MAGVHLDTEHLIGCSNSTVAVIDCSVDLQSPITVPLGALESLLKGGSDVHIAPEADKFYVKLDAETYATSTLIEAPYPDVKQAFRTDFVGTVEVHRGSILESLNRLQAMIKAEREMPTLILELRTDGFVPQLIFDIEVPELGRMQDSIHVTTEFAEDDPFSIGFAPHMLINALEHTEGNKIYIDFGNSTTRDRDKRSSLRIRDETGFFSYVSPKVIKND
jgi:DNA polymerase III sliding clamp (beta) subunit (PCNA family)